MLRKIDQRDGLTRVMVEYVKTSLIYNICLQLATCLKF
jgi:hypothetical protein